MNFALSTTFSSKVYDVLLDFADSSDFWTIFELAFGSLYDLSKAESIRSQWQSYDFSYLPNIEVVDSEVLSGANAGYASINNTIYVSEQFLDLAEPDLIHSVFLEEIGHFIDAYVNDNDSPGDEGAIFSVLVQEKELSLDALLALQSEDDHATIILNGQSIQLEQNGIDNSDNSSSTARDIGLLSTARIFNDFVGNTDPIDYYKFSLSATSNVSLQLGGVSQGFVYAHIGYDGNNNGLIDNGEDLYSTYISTSGTAQLNPTLGASDKYYVRIDRTANANSNYSLTLSSTPAPPSLAVDPGNTLSAAYNLGTLTTAQTLKEFVGNTDPIDYYKFSLSATSNVSLQLGGVSQGFVYAHIGYDGNNNGLIDNGEDLYSTYISTSGTAQLNPTLGASDKYYVRIDRTANANSNYSLTLVNTTNSNPVLPTINLVAVPISVVEDGTTNLVYTFTRTGATINALTVNYTVSGTAIFNTDYTQTGATTFTASTGTVTFAAGSASATIVINPTADSISEPNETVALTLTSGASYAVGVSTSVIGTITDDEDLPAGVLTFNSSRFSVREDGTPVAAVKINRIGGSAGAVSTTVTLQAGTAQAQSDYTNTGITVNFAAGETSKIVAIPIVNDTIAELDETLQLTLTAPTGGAIIGQQGSATLTIVDNDGSPIIGFPQGASGSNKGQSTIVISGQKFSPTDQVSLVTSNGTVRSATQTYWVSDTETWATFDLQGLSTGRYDVRITNATGVSTSNNAFTVTNGSLGNVQTKLSYPSSGVVTVTYTNVGRTDVVAPLFRLVESNATARFDYLEGLTTSSALSNLLNLGLGTGKNGPAGILSAGESGSVSFNYQPNGNGLISFAVEQLNPDQVIDWATIKTQYRADYPFVDSIAWDAIWSNFTAAVGQTYGQFQREMADNATYLSQLGDQPIDLARLFAFEWKQAANTLTNVDLLSTTDVVDAAPGLSLTFERTFHQSIAERYNLGTLGRGWSSQWDVRATTDRQGNVVIRSVGDLQRVFEKQTNGSYLGDDGATLTLNNGEYRLREANGTVSLFGSGGKLSFVEDTNGNRITLQYNNTLLSKLVHSNGDSLTLAYNPQGRLRQITDSTGQVSSYSYDISGEKLLSVTTSQGTTTYIYDTSSVATKTHSLLSVTSDQGYQRNFVYDNQGRLTQESSNGQTQTLSYAYDNLGKVTVTDSTGISQSVLLNDRGNAGQIRGVNNQNLLFRYDADGNLTGATLPNGGQTVYGYDASGNLTQQRNLAGQNVRFTYDSTFNQLTGFTDPKGNGVGYGYDAKGNLNKITYADGSSQQFGVDAAGNIISSVNRRGSTIAYIYNPSGQLTKKQYADGSSVVYGYDARGNVTSVIDATGTTTLQYDAANQLTGISYPNGRSLQYTYNADGQRTKFVANDGYTVNYSYDAVGRLKSLTDGAGQNIISYDYDSAGRLTKETNGNGTYTTYEYDSQSQLTRLINYQVNNTVNSRFEYAYDNLGRRTSMTTLEGTFQYGYDAIGQLTSVVMPTGRTLQYQYDAAGNRLGVTDNGTTTNYSSNNLNEYTSVGNAIYAYDRDGNLISKTQGGQTSTYTYNAENRLTKVVTPQGTWEYQYDGLGNRVATIANGQRTEYLLDPTGLGNIIGEYNGTGNLVAHYTQGIGLVSRVDGSNNANYYDADALGSTVGLTATNGSYVNRYSYLPFGEDLTKVEGVANPFEYVGQWGVMDEGNGLDFMRARFYDSSLGRFVVTDLIGLNAGDSNFYRYGENNPVNYIDPLGECKIDDFVLKQISGFIFGKLGGFVGIGVGYTIGAVVGGLVGGGLGFLAGLGAGAALGVSVGARIGAKFGGRIGGFLGGVSGGILGKPTTLGDDSELVSGTPKSGCFEFGDKSTELNPSVDLSPPPTLAGGTYNDPHLQTLDGLRYDFQSVGEFTLLKSITDDFEIQTRQQPWGTSTSASANAAIAITLGGQRIALYANQTQKLVINGAAVTLPNGSLYAVGQNLITRQGSQYSIITATNDVILVNDRGSFLNIKIGLSEDRKGKVTGLLGNFNNNRNDDYALRNGTLIGGTITTQQLYGDYANSWRITQATSLFDYAVGQTTATFTDLTFPRNVITLNTLTAAQRAAAEQTARNAGIADPDALDDAIVDIALTNGAPEFIQGAIEQQRINTITGTNTLINPDGVGDSHWLASNTVIPYTIRFSNNAAQGTAPVATVTITQQLDSDLDLSTFSLKDIGFSDIVFTVPPGLQNYSQRLDLRSTRGIYVDINAGLNPITSLVTWTFTAIEPTTGNPVTDPTQGFLPPSNGTIAGQGVVGYSIQPKPNTPNSTRIDAQASITFNNQTPIQTNPVFNTLDSDIPSSSVTALPATTTGTAFTVAWTSSETGSGLASYDIFASTNGNPFILWKDDTTSTSATYIGNLGNTYAFYSIARDNVGNVEAAPTTPDTQITLLGNQRPTVANPIADQTTPEDLPYRQTIALNTFQDLDVGDDTLTYSASLSNNQPLPTWLNFDPTTRTLSGTPADPAALDITITATDLAGSSTSDTFNLTITPLNLITGTSGNNQLTGTPEPDRLIGTAPTRIPGYQEIDTLTGNSGADLFILGTRRYVFYDDSLYAQTGWWRMIQLRSALRDPGLGDYAIIKDFNPTEGDRIQLKGNASQYQLGTSPIAALTGTAIFLTAGQQTPELIGIIQGSAPPSLSTNYFTYV
jgi:RHS repeat-associated protein